MKEFGKKNQNFLLNSLTLTLLIKPQITLNQIISDQTLLLM